MFDPTHTEILYPSTGRLRYHDEFRLIVEIDQQLVDYYRSLIPQWLVAQRTRYPAHITVVRQGKELPVHLEYWGKHDGQLVTFYYCPLIQMGKVYFWLNIFCCELEEVRLELGLPVVSQFGLPPEGFRKYFHTTIANLKS